MELFTETGNGVVVSGQLYNRATVLNFLEVFAYSDKSLLRILLFIKQCRGNQSEAICKDSQTSRHG